MRLSFALAACAAVVLGGATAAQADAPPAAPIFYCPTPGKAPPAAAATPARSPAHVGHAIHTSAHRPQGCPVVSVAASPHRLDRAHARHTVIASNAPPRPHPPQAGDVSASQAFIYRYERALHGLDARAADEAWAEGHRPPCPEGHCPDRARHGPPIGGPVLAQREAPPTRLYAQVAPPAPAEAPRVEHHPLPPLEHAPPLRFERASPPPAPAPPPRAYAWQDDHAGYQLDERAQEDQRARRDQQAQEDERIRERERVQASASVEETERAGGWRYSEVDGQGRYQHWGDHFADEPGWNGGADARREAHGEQRARGDEQVWNDRDGWQGHDDHGAGRRDDGYDDRRWAAPPRYRCPPPVAANSCSAGPDAPVRHSDAVAAGRDPSGYLTWPGKTE